MAAQPLARRDVMALFPDYIYKRFAGHDETRIARDAGISVDAITLDSLGSLAYAPQIADEGFLSVARYRWRIPYQARDPWTPVWTELVANGLALRIGNGWSLSERGTGLCNHLHREARRHLESISVAPAVLGRLTAALTSLADHIPSEAERATCAHRGLPLQDEIRTDMVRIDRAISELWNFRDDSHIAAWQSAGYTGPRLDALSQVWEGCHSLEELAGELEGTQERTDLEDRVKELVESGDIECSADLLTLTTQGKDRRDAIERDTDIRYFHGWPSGANLTTIADDLAVLIASIPG